MKKVAILILLSFFFTNVVMTEEDSRPMHHLKDGTFTNTSGVSNNKSLNDIYEWITDRNSIS